jgi:hypothetical protein
MASMIGRRHHLVIDCPDPLALATFYSGLLGQPITYRSDDFVVASDNATTSRLAFRSRPATRRRPGRTRPGRSRCTST